ncbi:hypothetical protein BS50DRAFT_678384 [Corynespora cassiicola Philippines]|uniref:Chitin synthesis regulation, congo red resistance, RCR protein n=1 Tax=Corynespora cassiicola Philippines TaxID=1448308 RepID=A0A2T2NFM6_CORCC|nr:hypothetical protein BS50DRAFT_678384 [Corynespora cassiicola Philippines]
MAPTLEPRYYECWYENGNRYCRRNAWNDWVRWVVLAVVIIGFFLLFVLCSCITARRRRKAGRQPFYGTGWAAPGQHNAQPYYNSNYPQPPPQYSAQPPQNSYYGQSQGYYGQQPYGQQQNGVELQSPQPAYNRGGDDVYAPPPGPPPGKGGDGIVR